MNRSSAAAVAAAAVLGVVGGTYAASLGIDLGGDDGQRAGDQKTSRSPGTSTPTRSEETKAPSSPAQLLYMDSENIHDGYTHVAVSGIDIKSVDSLVRISGGWLVVTADPQETDALLGGTVVAANGDQTDLGAFDGHWDINEDGTLFVAHHDDGYRVTNLADAAAVDVDLSAPSGTTATSDAAFTGNAVLTGWSSATGDPTTLRTDLANGRRKVIPTGDLTGWTASPRGLLMTGEVIDEATSCLEGGRVLGDHGDWWRTCEWRGYGPRPQYTPDGERLLVVPSDTDGFGPGLYGVLDSETGKIENQIQPPDWTVNAEWGDNDEAFALVQKHGGGAGWSIYRCKVGDECAEERESTLRLVLGAGV
jgi:hypothetical protein